MRALLTILLVGYWATAPAQDQPNPLPGQRFRLTDGPLFIPAGVKVGANGVDLTLHLHGAPATVEKNFTHARQPGILVNVTLPGLSAVYAKRFSETNAFHRILDETRAQLKLLDPTVEPQFRSVTVTSFSAGFGGVRELLKDPAAFTRIDVLVMADSIYAGYLGEPAARKLNPANMEGFLKFARAAAAGRKCLILSHSAQRPEGYASTTETADYLIAQLDGQREALSETWAGGLQLTSRFRKGHFDIYGFAGETGRDHMKHLDNLALWLERGTCSHSAP